MTTSGRRKHVLRMLPSRPERHGETWTIEEERIFLWLMGQVTLEDAAMLLDRSTGALASRLTRIKEIGTIESQEARQRALDLVERNRQAGRLGLEELEAQLEIERKRLERIDRVLTVLAAEGKTAQEIADFMGWQFWPVAHRLQELGA